MLTAGSPNNDLLITVIVLGCVVGVLLLSLVVTCACLCRYTCSRKKTKIVKAQPEKKSTTETNSVNKEQNIDAVRPKEADDGKIQPSFAYFYHKPEAENHQMVARVKVNENTNRFGASALNYPGAGYQPTIPWPHPLPRIAVNGASTASNCGRWNPVQEGRVVLNSTSWNVQQGTSEVPVCAGGESQPTEFRPSQQERVVLNAVPGSYSQGEGTHASVLYPVLS